MDSCLHEVGYSNIIDGQIAVWMWSRL